MKVKGILLIYLSLSILLYAETDAEKATLRNVGDDAPAITVTTLAGNQYNLAKMQEKVVLINFFATWCGPCNAEIPHLNQEVYAKIKADDFMMVGIGREHVADSLAQFVEKKNINYPIAPDPNREIYSQFAERYIPRNFVIGKSGKIIYQCVGFDRKDFEKMIDVIKAELD